MTPSKKPRRPTAAEKRRTERLTTDFIKALIRRTTTREEAAKMKQARIIRKVKALIALDERKATR